MSPISTRFSLHWSCVLGHTLWKFDNEVKMVYYFTSNAVTPSAFIYVGKDKVESAQSLRSQDSKGKLLIQYR